MQKLLSTWLHSAKKNISLKIVHGEKVLEDEEQLLPA